MATKRDIPEALKVFLERDAGSVGNHWLEITEAMLGSSRTSIPTTSRSRRSSIQTRG